MAGITNDPVIIAKAIGFGLIPALLWLWFWLKEDKENPEPKGLLILTFILGMFAVVLVLPLEKLAKDSIANRNHMIVVLAALEELFKFFAVGVLALKSKFADEPVDFPIYMMTAALGFAGLENALFLVKPLSIQSQELSLLAGNLRFLGATLLHAVASGFIGVSLGMGYYSRKIWKRIYLLGGIIVAIALHSAFNFLIMKRDGDDFMQVFALLWVVAVILIIIFEKLRRTGVQLTADALKKAV
jgi:RsiW-degrading membrane proteinase PrsW (M82 family)